MVISSTVILCFSDIRSFLSRDTLSREADGTRQESSSVLFLSQLSVLVGSLQRFCSLSRAGKIYFMSEVKDCFCYFYRLISIEGSPVYNCNR